MRSGNARKLSVSWAAIPGTFIFEVREDQRAYEPLVDDARAPKLCFETTRADGTPPGIISQIFSPEGMRRELLETRYIANARRLAGALLGVADEDVRYGGLMLIHEPAGAGRDTPWHQDEAYWDFPPTRRSHSLSI